MNIFEHYKDIFIETINIKNIDKKIKNKIAVEIPKQKIFGDISFNAPLILGSFLKKSPLVLAEEFKKNIINNNNDFEKIEVVKPGFINFTFKKSILLKFLSKIQNNFGKSNNIIKKKINIEFVSANPTGPLHIGHCRGAIFGDILCNFLKYYGHTVLLKNIILMIMVTKLIYF